MGFLRMAQEIQDRIVEIRRHLHRNPELSFQEFETANLVTQILRDEKIEVSRIGETGVVGLIRGERKGKTIAIRADMDALPIIEETELDFTSSNPGVMHACGHDFHTSILLGAAILLNQCRDKIKGNIKFIFQPAEEKMDGAVSLMNKGVLSNPNVDAILSLHCWPELPAGTIGVRKGAFMSAADQVELKIIGNSGHAAHPHKCIDPIVIAGHVITQLQTIVSREVAPIDSAVITFGKIQGGSASNIIAPHVTLHGTVRTTNPETRQKIADRLKKMVTLTAESMNGKAEVNYTFGSPPLINDENIVDIVENAASDLLGKDHVHYLENPSLGGEDFSYYLQQVPGAMFRLGTANELDQSKLALHNSKLIFDEKALTPGIAVFCETAVRYLND